MPYLILMGCSTRVRPDPRCEDWIEYRPGNIVTSFPAHVPVKEWLASGHVAEIAPVKPAKGGHDG